ncbi:MAG TPA: hypothetical protein VK920_06770 [Solirubrobacterales bacterium]|nr:hypothetical protein [Solirubrobacterales bacterium]
MSTPAARRPPSYVFAYIVMATALVGAFLAVVIVGGLRGFTASDRFGTVPMPGRETLDLPVGDVTVYFQEDVDLGDNENLRPPGDIRLDVRPADGGEPLALDPDGFSNEVSGNFGSRVSIGDLDVSDGGDYVVTAARTAENRNQPAIVFGDDLFDGFVSALPLGLLVLAAGLGAAALLFLITYVRRRRLTEAGPTLPQ